MTDTQLSAGERASHMLDAFHAGDMERVLALGAVLAPDTADETTLLLLGAAQHATQRITEALATFRQLVRRSPATFEYWNNLGIVAREANELDLAERALSQAATLAPHDTQVQYNLGLLYAHQQRWLEARHTLLGVIEQAPDFVEARLQAAHACHICGDNPGEEAMLAGAAQWPPQPLEQALILATLLSSQGEQAAALRVLEQAVLPDGADAETGQLRRQALRAALYERSNQIERASDALALVSPERLESLPEDQQRLRCEGWLAHAAVAARKGEHVQATELYRRVIAATPTHDMGANAAFGLASSLDKRNLPQEAWQAASQAHAAQWEIARGIVPELTADGSTPLAMSQHRVSRLQHDGWPPLVAPCSERSPVFVVGFPRSGTTLLEQMIDAHPDFRSMDERAFMHELTERMTLAGQHYPDDLAQLNQGDTDQLRALYGNMVRNVIPDLGTHRLVDKNPLNMLCLPMIARLFPEARIILCLRHPCDVLLSCFMQPFRSPAFMVLCSSLERLAKGYVQAFEHWFHHVDVFAPRVLEWRYESVVTRFDDHVARLGHFLEVEDATPMARFAEHARAKGYISTPSYAQVTQGIHRKAVNRWHAYREYFEPVLPILRPMMQRLGYDA
ncbi:sulfotransferase family protein [Dyella sp. ASV21]|uniref:tetratricopeptide repeat-containing sulfotransferase family protein n=1 Tax=Dyella sp. ASV21 TaxID=2795114 RepID=UPI0018EA439D|nr:sulfotransferase family protein [Dyella sp. ASV21]